MAVRIVTMIIFAAAVIAITMVVYLAVYRRRINRRLESVELGEDGGARKPMLPPILAFIFTLIGVTIVGWLVVVVLAASVYSLHTTGSGSPEPTVSDCMMDREYLDNSPLKGYSPGDELPGYVKYEADSGDIHFIYYVYNDCWSDMFPQILIYPEYTGDGKAAAFGEQMTMTDTDNGVTGFGSYGSTPGEMLFHGFSTKFFHGEFRYEYYVTETNIEVTESTDQDSIRAGALASGTLIIDLGHLEELTYSYRADQG